MFGAILEKNWGKNFFNKYFMIEITHYFRLIQYRLKSLSGYFFQLLCENL